MSASFRYRQIALIGSFSSRDCERPSILVAVDLWTGTIGHIRHFGQISLNPNFLLTPRHSRSPPVYNWRWLGNISQIARISHHDKLHLSGCCLTVTLMELWEYVRSVKDWREVKVFTWNMYVRRVKDWREVKVFTWNSWSVTAVTTWQADFLTAQRLDWTLQSDGTLISFNFTPYLLLSIRSGAKWETIQNIRWKRGSPPLYGTPHP